MSHSGDGDDTRTQGLRYVLRGVTGLVAAGIADAGQSPDRMGVYAQSPRDFHRVFTARDTMSVALPMAFDDGVISLELRQWCQRALRGCINAIELLWLPIDMYDVRTELGDELIALRRAFSSQEHVRHHYVDLARERLETLEFLASERVQRSTVMTECARELLLLCWQGHTFYATGELPIRVDDPLRFKAFGQRIAAGHVADARRVIDQYDELFERTRSPLPIDVDVDAVDAWLHRVRLRLIDELRDDE